MELILRRLANGTFAPADEDSLAEAGKIKIGSDVRATITRSRNLGFHRKFFTLIGMLYEMWEERAPEIEYRGRPVLPNKDRFREDLTILAGMYDATYDITGAVRLRAKSISFAKMTEDEFEQLYSRVIQVALDKVVSQPGLTPEILRRNVDRVLAFD